MGLGLRTLIQAGYFVLLARSLGPDSYGAFVAVVSMAAVLGPFSGMGTPNLFIKNVRSGKRDPAVCWGNGLAITVIAGVVFSGLVVAMTCLFHFKAKALTVVFVCFADLIFMKVTELATFGFAALDRRKQSAMQSVMISGLRFTGIAALIGLVHQVTLPRWVVVYVITSILGAVFSLVRGSQLWGNPVIDLRALREDAGEGLFFSIGSSATTVYNDIDKIMLSKLSDLTSTGIYATAYRVIDVSMTPVRSLVGAAYPHFFRKGVSGMRATYEYALSLIGKAWIFGLFMSAILWCFAPALPLILGSKYGAVVPALRWLAPIPLLRCVHLFLADALSGAGRQRIRAGIQVGVALMNVGLNLILLPVYSWRGAAWTSVGCDALLVVVFAATALYYCHREEVAIVYAA